MVRMIARIRVGGRDDENSTAYYAYVDGGEIRPVKEPAPIIEDGWGKEVSTGFW
jgi:hypothetical protein